MIVASQFTGLVLGEHLPTAHGFGIGGGSRSRANRKLLKIRTHRSGDISVSESASGNLLFRRCRGRIPIRFGLRRDPEDSREAANSDHSLTAWGLRARHRTIPLSIVRGTWLVDLRNPGTRTSSRDQRLEW
jgi:hypothetical protein